MSRIAIAAVEHTPEASRPLLAAVQKQLGVIPNLMKVLAHSPAALGGYLSLSEALGRGALSAGLRERIALAVAEYNDCEYCLSAHAYLAVHVARLTSTDIEAARAARAGDAATTAALVFARKVLVQHGHIENGDLARLREAGFDEPAILEIVAHVALNVLTNYINNVAGTDVDFPRVAPRAAA